MRIVVRRDRNDKNWLAYMDGGFRSIGQTDGWARLKDALLAVHHEAPWAQVFVDERTHYRLDNGMVFLQGEQNLRPVEFINSPNKF